MKAIQITETGGPEVLRCVDLPTPQPKPNEALVRITAIGVNFVDTYFREGRYSSPLPFTPGQEAAGVVAEVGKDVRDVKPGDRVAYAGVQGSYAQYAVVPADRLARIPDGVDDRSAAATMLQGMTAHYLLHDSFPVKRGQIALVHAGAGGVGLLLVQMAHQLGTRVIATVSTDEKANLARQAGADDIILYTYQDFEVETRRLTEGKGVDVVYDSVGKDTFQKGLNVLRPRGYMVLYGGSSGAVPPFDPIQLTQKGSLFLTRPSLNHYIATRQELEHRASAVLGMVASGQLKLRIEHIYPLCQAQQAHRDLAGKEDYWEIVAAAGLKHSATPCSPQCGFLHQSVAAVYLPCSSAQPRRQIASNNDKHGLYFPKLKLERPLASEVCPLPSRLQLHKFLLDLIAGITVGLVALPLAMAFSIASGLTPQAGIYCAIVTGFLISAARRLAKLRSAARPAPSSSSIAGIVAAHGS